MLLKEMRPWIWSDLNGICVGMWHLLRRDPLNEGLADVFQVCERTRFRANQPQPLLLNPNTWCFCLCCSKLFLYVVLCLIFVVVSCSFVPCSSIGSKTENQSGLFESQHEVSADGKSDGHVLRHFFDDWPRSLQESDNAGSNSSPMNSATCLSISMPGNSSSDVSLKLSTGIGEEPGSRDSNAESEQPQLNWASGWATNHVSSMGGPLAEALRSSTSNSSPTSVLHQLPRGSASETSFVSTWILLGFWKIK